MSRFRITAACVWLLLASLACAAQQDVKQLDLPAKDIVYDTVTRRLYASVPGTGGSRANSVTVIDPESGKIEASVYVGSEPGRLALSWRSKYLYVALDGSGAVRVFDLAARAAGLQFPVGPAVKVVDMVGLPGDDRLVAVAREGGSYDNGLAIYENGVPRPAAVNAGNSLAFTGLPDRLYGFESRISPSDLRLVAIDKTGAHDIGHFGGPLVGNVRVTGANGLVYSDDGKVLDPEAQILVGTFSGIGYLHPVAPDPKTGRVYFLSIGLGGPTKIQAFDSRTFVPAGELQVPVEGGAYRLVRWGDHGLAFNTGQKVVIVRTPLVPDPLPPAELSLAQTSAAASAGGKGADYTLTVANQGKTPATGVFLADRIAEGFDVESMKASQGTVTFAQGSVRADLGVIQASGQATVTVHLTTKAGDQQGGAVLHSATVRANEPNAAGTISAIAQTLGGQVVSTAIPGSTAPAAAAAAAQGLTGAWIALDQKTTGAGAELRAILVGQFKIKNAGARAANASRLRFFIQDGPNYTEDALLLQEVPVPSLTPGQTYLAGLRAPLAKGNDAIGLYVIAVMNAGASSPKPGSAVSRRIP